MFTFSVDAIKSYQLGTMTARAPEASTGSRTQEILEAVGTEIRKVRCSAARCQPTREKEAER